MQVTGKAENLGSRGRHWAFSGLSISLQVLPWYLAKYPRGAYLSIK